MESSDEDIDNDGPRDQFFIDPDIHHISRQELGIIELTLDDLWTDEPFIYHTVLR